ncbi:MAG TPA: RodZ domain-containing protein [Bryobacteraceae bacterium]|nr:RodZ domain-containing protein [Bryobacteraceae bacterium]
MARLRVRVELNRGGVGVPLHKLASVVHEAQRFFEMLAEDVHIAQDRGEWLGFDFDNESLNFTAEFVGPVSGQQAQAFYAAFDGVTSLRRATIAQFTQITEAIGEDELIGFGLYQSDQETEPGEWRCLSRRDALRIADEIQHLLGVAGEMQKATTHLPAIVDDAGARLFKDRAHRSVALTDASKLPELVREVESNLSKRISRLEEDVESHTHSIRDLRESSAATEESFKGLLNAVENFCGQATRQLERLAPPSELPAPIRAASMPAVTAAAVPIAAVPIAAVPTDAPAAAAPAPLVRAEIPAPAPPQTPQPPEPPEPLPAASAGRNWRALAVAGAVLLVLITAGLLWWPSHPSDQATSQSASSAAPSSVIVSSQTPESSQSVPNTSQPGAGAPTVRENKPNPVPRKDSEKEHPSPMPSRTQPVQPPEVTPAKETAAADIVAPAESAGEVMRVEMEAQEPVWVMVTDNEGKILIARTLQANETRTLDLTAGATLRTGNAGGLRLRLNGKDLGTLGPTGKIRDVQFKAGAYKVTAPDAG